MISFGRLLLVVLVVSSYFDGTSVRAAEVLPWHDPKTEPVTLRFREFPPSLFIISFDFDLHGGGETITGSGEITGTTSGLRNELGILQSVQIMQMNIESRGLGTDDVAELSQIVPFAMELVTSDRGEVLSFEVDSENSYWRSLTPEERDAFTKEFLAAVSVPLHQYPILPVKAGDSVRSYTFPLEFGGTEVPTTFEEVVKGGLTFNRRPALLIESSIDNPGADSVASGNGYSIVDNESGMPVYTQATFELTFGSKEAPLTVKLDFEYELNIDEPIDSSVRSDDAISERVVGESLEDKLRTLKKLLDDGLISEHEAAEKRSSLLKVYRDGYRLTLAAPGLG